MVMGSLICDAVCIFTNTINENDANLGKIVPISMLLRLILEMILTVLSAQYMDVNIKS
mgnify:CR=1 FL=1